ncbi:MAG: hypothetical protein ABIF40_03865 [archaeon]
MRNYQILNTRDVKKIYKQIEEQFGIKEKLDLGFLKNNKDKIFLISKALDQIELEKMKTNRIGMYFGKLEKNGFRPSIEGSQMIKAKKNIVSLNSKEIEEWMKGEDIESKTKEEGPYVLIQHDKDIFGCGRLKDGKIHNMVPKERQLKI